MIEKMKRQRKITIWLFTTDNQQEEGSTKMEIITREIGNKIVRYRIT